MRIVILVKGMTKSKDQTIIYRGMIHVGRDLKIYQKQVDYFTCCTGANTLGKPYENGPFGR